MITKKIIVFCSALLFVAYVEAMNNEALQLYRLVSKREFLWDKYIDDRKKFFETMPDVNHEERERLAVQKIVFNKELYRQMGNDIEVMAKEMGVDQTVCSFGVTPKLVQTLERWTYNAEIKK